jgi:hypothetical protein
VFCTFLPNCVRYRRLYDDCIEYVIDNLESQLQLRVLQVETQFVAIIYIAGVHTMQLSRILLLNLMAEFQFFLRVKRSFIT